MSIKIGVNFLQHVEEFLSGLTGNALEHHFPHAFARLFKGVGKSGSAFGQFHQNAAPVTGVRTLAKEPFPGEKIGCLGNG